MNTERQSLGVCEESPLHILCVYRFRQKTRVTITNSNISCGALERWLQYNIKCFVFFIRERLCENLSIELLIHHSAFLRIIVLWYMESPKCFELLLGFFSNKSFCV